MEVTARGAPAGRPGEPNLAPEHVEAGLTASRRADTTSDSDMPSASGPPPRPGSAGRSASRSPRMRSPISSTACRAGSGRIAKPDRRYARVISAAAGSARSQAACGGDGQGGRRHCDSPYRFSVISPVRRSGWRAAVGRSCTVVWDPAGDRLSNSYSFPGLRLLSCGHQPARPASTRTPPRWQARHQRSRGSRPNDPSASGTAGPGQHVQPRERRSAP